MTDPCTSCRPSVVAAIAAMALSTSTPVIAQETPQTVGRDEIVVSGDGASGIATATADETGISGVSGRLAVNIASGNGNQEMNGAAIALGDIATGASFARQEIGGSADEDRQTRIVLQGDAFAGTNGLASVNIVAGSQNQAANLALFSLGHHGALSDQLLEQSRAPTEPKGGTGGTGLRNDVVEVGDDAFRNSSGLVQVNLIGGERNSSANTFALSVLGEGPE